MASEGLISRCKKTLEQKKAELLGKSAGCPTLTYLRAFEDGSGDNLAQVNSNNHKLDQKRLREVEDALQRIAQGTYGVCILCGKPIPPERLSEYPEVACCVTCKQKIKLRQPIVPRPAVHQIVVH